MKVIDRIVSDQTIPALVVYSTFGEGVAAEMGTKRSIGGLPIVSRR